jgi:hypothetical protein
MRQHFTEEEANAILRKAVERQPMGDEMSREQLESIAKELGISQEALAVAETEWHEEQHEKSLRAAFDAERRAAFWSRVPRALAGSAFLFFFLLVFAHGAPRGAVLSFPFLMVFFIIAMKTVFRGVEAYQRGPTLERQFHEWLEERERGALPRDLGTETYATPESARRMRRRIMR